MLPILPKKLYEPQAQTHIPKKVVHKESNMPKIVLLIGLALIATQAIPLGISYVSGFSAAHGGSNFIPVSEGFLSSLTTIEITDPGAEYLSAVTQETASSTVSTIDQKYNHPMKLSIPHASISRVSLAPNITGSDAKIYDEVLKYGVAHLKGTSVPGDAGTSVIYGHSGIAGLLANKNTPQIIFSRLDTVSIGDTMTIERDGTELHYVVSGKKIIEPENLTFLNDTDAKERAVLLTCWPLGIGTKRLVVIADRVK